MKGKTMSDHNLAYALTVVEDLRTEDPVLEDLYTKLRLLVDNELITYSEFCDYQNALAGVSAGYAFLQKELENEIEQNKKKSILTRLFK